MKIVVVLLFCCQACLGASLFDSSCNYACADILSPVCGSNGVTYGNVCELHLAKCHGAHITVRNKGVCPGYVGPYSPGKRLVSMCPPRACIMIYMPVCGSDGMTYGNSCELSANNCTGHIVYEAHTGRC